jgi:hypothetical protein
MVPSRPGAPVGAAAAAPGGAGSDARNATVLRPREHRLFPRRHCAAATPLAPHVARRARRACPATCAAAGEHAPKAAAFATSSRNLSSDSRPGARAVLLHERPQQRVLLRHAADGRARERSDARAVPAGARRRRRTWVSISTRPSHSQSTAPSRGRAAALPRCRAPEPRAHLGCPHSLVTRHGARRRRATVARVWAGGSPTLYSQVKTRAAGGAGCCSWAARRRARLRARRLEEDGCRRGELTSWPDPSWPVPRADAPRTFPSQKRFSSPKFWRLRCAPDRSESAAS